jgi:hypothetical protein
MQDSIEYSIVKVVLYKRQKNYVSFLDGTVYEHDTIDASYRGTNTIRFSLKMEILVGSKSQGCI